ncbi:biopolymer transporter ExbD [candidate division KSB1 bacterium]|nr:MAG: biopolymer transporter ExbD [candidate division KSB1 bacterium]
MILGKRKKDKDVEIPSSSLPDIVFLLLIFFLVTTSIDTEKGLDLVLPPPGNVELKIPKKNLANMLVNAQGQVLLDGKEINIRDVARIIKQKIAENDKLVISLKTDADTDYQTYITVLDQLKKAGAKKISLAEPEQ